MVVNIMILQSRGDPPASLTDPFTATNSGRKTITVTDAGHGAILNDFVTFSGATLAKSCDRQCLKCRASNNTNSK